jgi:hypothetical protein
MAIDPLRNLWNLKLLLQLGSLAVIFLGKLPQIVVEKNPILFMILPVATASESVS